MIILPKSLLHFCEGELNRKNLFNVGKPLQQSSKSPLPSQDYQPIEAQKSSDSYPRNSHSPWSHHWAKIAVTLNQFNRIILRHLGSKKIWVSHRAAMPSNSTAALLWSALVSRLPENLSHKTCTTEVCRALSLLKNSWTCTKRKTNVKRRIHYENDCSHVR